MQRKLPEGHLEDYFSDFEIKGILDLMRGKERISSSGKELTNILAYRYGEQLKKFVGDREALKDIIAMILDELIDSTSSSDAMGADLVEDYRLKEVTLERLAESLEYKLRFPQLGQAMIDQYAKMEVPGLEDIDAALTAFGDVIQDAAGLNLLEVLPELLNEIRNLRANNEAELAAQITNIIALRKFNVPMWGNVAAALIIMILLAFIARYGFGIGDSEAEAEGIDEQTVVGVLEEMVATEGIDDSHVFAFDVDEDIVFTPGQFTEPPAGTDPEDDGLVQVRPSIDTDADPDPDVSDYEAERQRAIVRQQIFNIGGVDEGGSGSGAGGTGGGAEGGGAADADPMTTTIENVLHGRVQAYYGFNLSVMPNKTVIGGIKQAILD
jgi:hypothetical protein